MASKKTNYFSHDSNARNDDKILRLRMRYGMEGYGVYFAILERLREEADYTANRDYEAIAFDLRCATDLAQSIVEDFDLFTVEEKRFYSPSFKRRMEVKDAKTKARSEAGKKGMKSRYSYNTATETNNGDITTLQKNDNDVITNEQTEITRKVKESKEKKSKVNALSTDEGKGEIAASAPISAPTQEKPDKEAIKRRQEEKKKAFADTLKPFVEIYGKQMIRDFYEYWTEPNRSGTKWKFELERTWSLERRLRTWAERENKYNRNYDSNQNNRTNTNGTGTAAAEPERPKKRGFTSAWANYEAELREQAARE